MPEIKTRTFPELLKDDWEEIESLGLDAELLDKIETFDGTDPVLADVEWLQVYIGLDDKLARLRCGFYGRDREAKEWRAHIEEICGKLDEIRAEYIGGEK